MDDATIVGLYWQRSEQAIPETASKYGHYCYSVAHRIVNNREDSEECVNDTWLGAWNAIPPHRPDPLSVFLGKITRRLALGIIAAAVRSRWLLRSFLTACRTKGRIKSKNRPP